MDRQTKVEVVAQVTQATEAAKAIVLTGFSGLTVEAETQLRRDIRAVEGKYQVVRNSLVKRALNEAQLNALGDSLAGNNALVYTENDPIALMKAICDFAKTNKAITVNSIALEKLKKLSVSKKEIMKILNEESKRYKK